MARKARKAAAEATEGGPRGAREDIDRKIIDRTLELAATRGWTRTTLGDVARASGVSLASLYERFPSKTAIVRALLARIDAEVLSAKISSDEPIRDRLFDLVMRRFDALGPHKAGVRAIVADACRDPALALCVGPRSLRSIAWMGEAAGVGMSGPLGLLRIKLLAAAYCYVLRVWLGDESADGAATMAALDRVLKRLEMLENSMPWAKRPEASPAG
ncbi:MAG TPA: helix-turn-helix domain-containing protein [Alphaproteobacteria bacterium]|nr:helix-turn-helix domain-containing protein [Alphaproteobacteria bacterium]